jgi:integrase
LPWQDLPKLWHRLAAAKGMGAFALRFAILTAARSGEVRMATWAEVDLDAAVWIIPAGRMKAEREHRVPLSYHLRVIRSGRLGSATSGNRLGFG